MTKKKKKDKKDLEHQDKDMSYVTGKSDANLKKENEEDPPDTGGGDINDKEEKNG
jgi:hypothetical protein